MPDVFFALSLMMLPRLSMGGFFLIAVEFCSEAYVASKRMDAFFKIAEPPLTSHPSESDANGSMHVHNGNYGWSGQKDDKKPEDRRNSLRRILSKVWILGSLGFVLEHPFR